MQTFEQKYGPWALVTGASSGIGATFARTLAAKGLNLLLVARRKDRLDKLAGELSAQHGIKVKVATADLSQADSHRTVEEAAQGLEIGLLVNNAGTETHGAFLKSDPDLQASLVQLNAISPMRLTHHFGNQMAKRGRGGILFLSTIMAYQGVPYFANYAASKAYVLNLGESLHYELKKHGVDVTVLSPGLTDTEMKESLTANGVDLSKMGLKTMAAEPVVAKALQALGRKPSVIPGFVNRAFIFMGQRVFSRKGIASMFGGINEKALAAELK